MPHCVSQKNTLDEVTPVCPARRRLIVAPTKPPPMLVPKVSTAYLILHLTMGMASLGMMRLPSKPFTNFESPQIHDGN